MLVTPEAYPTRAPLSAYAKARLSETPMAWQSCRETVRRFLLTTASCCWVARTVARTVSPTYANFVMPGIEISLGGAASSHLSSFGISTS